MYSWPCPGGENKGELAPLHGEKGKAPWWSCHTEASGYGFSRLLTNLRDGSYWLPTLSHAAFIWFSRSKVQTWFAVGLRGIGGKIIYAPRGLGSRKNKMAGKKAVKDLSDLELMNELKSLGLKSGPITPTTKRLFENRLSKALGC